MHRHVSIAFLLVGLGLGVLLSRAGFRRVSASEMWYRHFAAKGLNPNTALGLFVAVCAIILVIQTIVTMRKGFVYGVLMERIYRADDPARFQLYRAIQFILVLAFMVIAALLLWRHSPAGAVRPAP